MLKDILLHGFRLNIDYTLELVADVPDEEMVICPEGFTNHPKFTIGHLISATALTATVMGAEYEMPAGWDELFRRSGPGDPRMPESEGRRYPHKERMLEILSEKYEAVVRLVRSFPDKRLQEPHPWRFGGYMPTVADVLYFQCLMHHSWHIGQLAEWRRMMGYDSALARMGSPA